MTAKNGTSILDFFHRLASAPERPQASDVLRDLSQLFNASAIGVGSLDLAGANLSHHESAEASPVFPWLTDADFSAVIQHALIAEVIATENGNWLVTAVHGPEGEGPRFAWVYRAGKRGWSEQERLQWTGASHALARWLVQNPTVADEISALERQLSNASFVTARLSHDFGNYLTGILGFTELSLSQAQPDTAQNRFLQEVLQSAQQGAAWIHRLQLFCRRSAAPAWPTRLASVLALEEARLRAAETSSLRWEVDLPNDLPLLDIDAGSVQLMLQELVNNAREATKSRGTITFAARAVDLSAAECSTMLGAAQPGPYVELSVTDDGPGIAPADRARLFHEVFFSTKPRRRGVGLLAVHGILHSARGGLRVESPPVGTGVSVRLFLPAAAIAELTPPAGAKKPPSVLLAHANPVLFDSLRVMLETRGCRVTVVDSPQATLSVYCAPKAKFALVIIDVNMPQMSGFDLARRIVDFDEDASLLFVCTQPSFHGLTEEELPKRFEMLRWPLQPAALLSAVQTALTRVQS